MKKWVAGLVLILGAVTARAQNMGLYERSHQYEDDPLDEVTHLQLGINTLSDNVYLARRDSVAMPYITPYIGYYFRSGFSLQASVSYGAYKKWGRFDRACLSGAYDRTFGYNMLAGIYAEQYFYYKKSTAVAASITQRAGLYWKYRNDLVQPQIEVTYSKGTSADIAVFTTLDHRFKLAQDKVNIYPAFTLAVGTQHFYDDYNVRRALKENNVLITTSVQESGKIRPMSLELSAKTTYWNDHWLITLIPTYAFPLGAATVNLPGRVIHEKLKNTFFVELDIRYRRHREEMITYRHYR